jgi:choline-sulfatase
MVTDVPLAGRLFSVAAGCAAALLTGCGNGEPDVLSIGRSAYQREGGTPSVVLVTVDTTRADHLSMYGAEFAETPNLHALAHQGVTFDRASAVTPITLPSHTSIHTGLYPPQHGVRNNGIHRADDSLTTLAERFADRGYATAAFVSAAVLERRYGLDQGFHVYDDDLSAGLLRFERMVPDRPASATVDAAMGWLDGVPDDQPVFLWVHLYDPHAVYAPPQPFAERFRERPYDGEIAFMDRELGRLFAHRRVGDTGTTVLTVIGDHGESLGQHGENTHAMLAYEATLHVPWILRAPGLTGKVHVSPPVSQVDLAPTLMDLAGLEPDDAMAGRSLVPLLEAKPMGWWDRATYSETWLPFYTYGWAKLQAVRVGGWKYIDAPEPELYDLLRDPGELSNLVDHRPDQRDELVRAYQTKIQPWEAEQAEADLVNDSEALERLRALGYVAIDHHRADHNDDPRPDPKNMVSLHVRLERARGLLRDGLHAQAAALLAVVLEQDPTNLAALLDLARAHEAGGDAGAARASLETALSLAPSSTTIRLSLASLEASDGHIDRADGLVRAVLTDEPENLEARLQAARLARSRGDTAETRRLLTEILTDHPDVPRVLVTHARLVDLPANRLEKALERSNAALERDPFFVPARLLVGELQVRKGLFDDALETYREGLRRRPDDPELHARLGLLASRVGAPGAEAHLREALRLDASQTAEIRTALGALLAEQGRSEDAERQYERVLATDPNHPGTRNNRAIALYRQGQVEEATDEWRALVDAHPDFADAHNNLAAASVSLGRWSAVERHARRALELDPHLIEAANNLGIALGRLGRRSEAAAVFEDTLRRAPDYWPAKVNLAEIDIAAGNIERAVELLESAVAQAPGAPDPHRLLGDLCVGPLNDRSRARKHYNAFLRRASPGDPHRAAVRRQLTNLED